MIFDFKLTDILEASDSGLHVVHSASLPKNLVYHLKSARPVTKDEKMAVVLDRVGEASSKSQGLPTTITSFNKFQLTGHRIYLKTEGGAVIGFIKVGEKNLFHRDLMGKTREIRPTCVLDFYVHESK